MTDRENDSCIETQNLDYFLERKSRHERPTYHLASIRLVMSDMPQLRSKRHVSFSKHFSITLFNKQYPTTIVGLGEQFVMAAKPGWSKQDISADPHSSW